MASENGENSVIKTVLNAGKSHRVLLDFVQHNGRFFQFDTSKNASGIDTKEIHLDKERVRALHGLSIPVRSQVEVDGVPESVALDPNDIATAFGRDNDNLQQSFWNGVLDGFKLRNPKIESPIHFQIGTELGRIIEEE